MIEDYRIASTVDICKRLWDGNIRRGLLRSCEIESYEMKNMHEMWDLLNTTPLLDYGCPIYSTASASIVKILDCSSSASFAMHLCF